MKTKRFFLILLYAFFPAALFAQECLFSPESPDTSGGKSVCAKKLGSHNSLSYLKPRWYWLPFNWMIRCQQLNLIEQIEHGVTYFDIRIRFKKNRVISAHGIIDYDVDVLKILQMLDSLSTEEKPLYLWIVYESKPLCKNPEIEELQAFMSKVKNDYPSLIFTQCYIKEPYTLVETITDVPRKVCYQYFRDYGATTFWSKLTGLKIPYPKYYAKRNNKKYFAELNDEVFSVLDFVDIQ
jgi:hypothetical protein